MLCYNIAFIQGRGPSLDWNIRMTNVQTSLKHAQEHFAKNGVRWTEKRARVLAGLVGVDRALSAYELADICKASGDPIPPMSIYRILDLLAENGLVHKLNLANKYVACAHISCSHSHQIPQFLICDRCSAVKEISISPSAMAELQQAMMDSGFTLQSPQIEMNCRCDECSSQPTE